MESTATPVSFGELIEKSIRDKTSIEEERMLLAPENLDIFTHELDRVARNIGAQLVRREAEMNASRIKLADDKAALVEAELKYARWLSGARKIHSAAETKAETAKRKDVTRALLADMAAYLRYQDGSEVARLLERIEEISPAPTTDNGAATKDDYDES